MTFGEAMEKVKQGHKVRRDSWHEKDLHIMLNDNGELVTISEGKGHKTIFDSATILADDWEIYTGRTREEIITDIQAEMSDKIKESINHIYVNVNNIHDVKFIKCLNEYSYSDFWFDVFTGNGYCRVKLTYDENGKYLGLFM